MYFTLYCTGEVSLSTSNWCKNPESVLQKMRISGILYKRIANLSSPKPKAQPIRSDAPAFCRISCLTIPHPNNSIHWSLWNISNSQDGCVNGKYSLTQRYWISVSEKFFLFYSIKRGVKIFEILPNRKLKFKYIHVFQK